MIISKNKRYLLCIILFMVLSYHRLIASEADDNLAEPGTVTNSLQQLTELSQTATFISMFNKEIAAPACTGLQ